MADRNDLQPWVIQALRDLGGTGRIVDLFYTWQYEMRWAGQQLPNNKVLLSVHGSRSQHWELAESSTI